VCFCLVLIFFSFAELKIASSFWFRSLFYFYNFLNELIHISKLFSHFSSSSLMRSIWSFCSFLYLFSADQCGARKSETKMFFTVKFSKFLTSFNIFPDIFLKIIITSIYFFFRIDFFFLKVSVAKFLFFYFNCSLKSKNIFFSIGNCKMIFPRPVLCTCDDFFLWIRARDSTTRSLSRQTKKHWLKI
jgi:hypothetical protein